MDIKDLIKQVRIDNKVVERKKEELERLRCLCEVTGINFEGDKVSGSTNNKRVEQAYLNYIEFKDSLNDYIAETINRRYKLMVLIDKLDKGIEIDIMYRYCFNNQSMQQIADATNYTRQAVYERYAKSIEKLEHLTLLDTN